MIIRFQCDFQQEQIFFGSTGSLGKPWELSHGIHWNFAQEKWNRKTLPRDWYGQRLRRTAVLEMIGKTSYRKMTNQHRVGRLGRKRSVG